MATPIGGQSVPGRTPPSLDGERKDSIPQYQDALGFPSWSTDAILNTSGTFAHQTLNIRF